MNTPNKINRVLLYSKKCQSCANLIGLLTNMNMLTTFQMYCVEDMIAQKQQLPPGITMVPALILPEINSIFQGKETFMWLEKIRTNYVKANMMNSIANNGPHGFVNTEMGGVSDSFAYTTADMAQPKSFLPYGQDDQYTIYTGHEGQKIKDKDQKKLIQEVEQKRKQFDAELDKNLSQIRENMYIEYEKQKILSKDMMR